MFHNNDKEVNNTMEKKYLISLSCSERFLRKTKMRVKPKAIYEFREFLENIANDFAHKIANFLIYF